MKSPSSIAIYLLAALVAESRGSELLRGDGMPGPSPRTFRPGVGSSMSREVPSIALPFDQMNATLEPLPTNSPTWQPSPSEALPTLSPAGSVDGFETSEVRCPPSELAESYRSIEVPFYYQVEAPRSINDVTLRRRIESSLLDALARNILTCRNLADGSDGGVDETSEGVRRFLDADDHEEARVIAALIDDAEYNEYACPWSCHVVESKLVLIVENSSEADDALIVAQTYTVVKLALLGFDRSMARVSYIGKNPHELTPMRSNKSEVKVVKDNRGLFAWILVFLTVLGALAFGGRCWWLIRSYNLKQQKTYSDKSNDSGTSTGVPGAIDITLSASSDDSSDLGGSTCSSDYAQHLVIAQEEKEALSTLAATAPPPIGVRKVLQLPRLPEEMSVDYGCEEWSV